MLTRRIIPCLDVRDGRVVKGVRFRDHRVVGDIGDLARRYRDEGADELVFYDITASAERRSVSVEWVRSVGRLLDIPFCVAGGIRSVDTARRILNAGADKISVNSPAIEDPALIERLAEAFGSQCVVVGVDSERTADGYRVYQYTGSEETIRRTPLRTMEWIAEAAARGAGEIVLNCMGSDGVGAGYDVEQLRYARAIVDVPLIASGGAGESSHFASVFRDADVDGALAAGVFHRGEIPIGELKRYLATEGVEVRT